MAFATGGGSSGPMADINVTPLVDVMLVLLIIFMLTAALIGQGQHRPAGAEQKGAPADSAAGSDPPVRAADRRPVLERHANHRRRAARPALRDRGQPQEQPPELAIKADKTSKYQLVANVMADARNAGMTKVAFVSQ